MIELESVKRMESLKQLIETVTGETYEDLTEAVKSALQIANIALNATATMFAQNQTIESIDIPLDMSGTGTIQEYFLKTTNLKTMKGIKSTSHIRYFNRAFQGSGVVSIELPFDLSNTVNGYCASFLQGAYDLEEIRFVTETINENNMSFSDNKKLSTESLQSIAEGLAFVTTAKTVYFSVKTTIPDDVKEIISNKGWTLVQR